jgi:hypothetical protein
MPKNQACPGVPRVNDLITDQEIAFARLILAGTMTDRAAAQTVGLNPDTAAYTKAKPRVRAYMVERRAAIQQQLVDQETDLSRCAVEELRRKNQWRQKVLDRLWEIAALPAEVTRGSITGQVKAISMIVAIEGLIPDRRAGSAQKNSATPPTPPDIYADLLREQQGKTIDPQPVTSIAEEEDAPGHAEPEPAPAPAEDAPGSTFDSRDLAFANSLNFSETTPSAPHAPISAAAPDARVPFSIKKNRFGRHR